MTTILVTGSSGQLGSEISDLSSRYSGYRFIFTDIDQLDITDRASCDALISEYNPSWIINAAAYTAVDRAEEEREKALLINGTGVRNIVSAIRGSGCRLIQISTDYIFDGTGSVPYDETAVPSPLSVYGMSKLAGEEAALSHSQSMVIRTSWLYSSYGNNFVRTILRKAGSESSLNVVFDQTGSPTWASDLASAIIEIISGVIQNRYIFIPGIFNYSDEGVCSWYDIAVETVRLAGSTCIINPIRSSSYPTLARRPAYSVLDNSKIKEHYELTIPHWRKSLENCITKIIRI